MLKLKRNVLFLALAATGFCVASGAYAQDAAEQEDARAPTDEEKKQEDAARLDQIVVRGFRQSVETAIAEKRDNTSIVEVISAEDIGKLPDVSIGEALARLPGLTAQRVDGRAQVISVRGLGPDFSTALLNGREQVTTGDNRGVEFDQYPAELLGGVVVYKTGDPTLIGQGLAGTVDLRTIRPLAHGRQSFSVNARYEFNEDSALNPDGTNKGFRAAATYIDQFADDTFGVTLGIAAQSTPNNQERFNAWGFPTTSEGDFIIGGAKPFVASNDLDRIGLIGTFEYQPTDNFHTTLDLGYSDFEETQQLRGIEFPLFWSNAQLRPGFTVEDGLVTEGVFDNVRGVMRNDLNERDAELFNFGWNTRYEFGQGWGVETDLSYSRSERQDVLLESYLGTGPGNENGAADSLGFLIRPNGNAVFSPSLDYSDLNQFLITDPQGWGGGAGLTQAGFINAPETEDELSHIRLSLDREFMQGAISRVTIGGDASRRDKDRIINQDFLVPPGGANSTSASAPIPVEALLSSSADLSFMGIPGHITLDPLFLLDNGFLTKVPISLSSFNVPQNWKVREDVFVGFLKADLDTAWAGIPVTGNFGVQVVYTDQRSTGFRVAGDQEIETGSRGAFLQVRDGDEYTRFLPSVNLIFEIAPDTKVRFGAARTMARARMDQLNAGLTLSANFSQLESTDPNRSFFSAGGGNATLKPTISNNVDLSLEHYFGDGVGYVALAGFYKDLQDFINPSDARLFDFSDFVEDFLTPAQQAQLGTPIGIASGPSNRGKGNIKGAEFTVSVPLDLVVPALEGFGVINSVSYTDSKVLLGDDPNSTTVPGLSKWVVNSTVYFEKAGFSARVGHRYRDEFLSEIFGLSATRITREAKSESVFDAQVSYEFQSGALKGLTILGQANNLTDEPFATFEQGNQRLVIDRQKFGRTFLVGASYRF